MRQPGGVSKTHFFLCTSCFSIYDHNPIEYFGANLSDSQVGNYFDSRRIWQGILEPPIRRFCVGWSLFNNSISGQKHPGLSKAGGG